MNRINSKARSVQESLKLLRLFLRRVGQRLCDEGDLQAGCFSEIGELKTLVGNMAGDMVQALQ